MSDDELNQLSVKELRAIRDQVDDAIRAAIARSRIQLTAKPAGPQMIDLERERDAWKARKIT